ncbi:hypothetical protein QE152_g24982 [Popillia japonica]|uniref:Uncharacterized protein n=1 Tax=Popillia japonica TaxID=7064 RepID=A0AAW1K3B2_POPJA
MGKKSKQKYKDVEKETVEQINSRLDNLLDKYSALFSKDMGKIKGLQANLKLKKDVQPFYIKARKVPHALLPKVDAELLRLETEGILAELLARPRFDNANLKIF